MGLSFSQVIGSKVTDFVLQDSVTTIGTGTPFDIGSNRTLTISITGTSVSRTINFEVSDIDGNFTSIMGVKLKDLTTDIRGVESGEKWTFDVTGLQQFRANLVAVSGGTVTVKGKAVV